jgi:hypothetical protein
MKKPAILMLFIAFGLLFAGRAAAFCYGTFTDPNAAGVTEAYDASTDRFFMGWSDFILDSTCAPLIYHPVPSGMPITGVQWNTTVHKPANCPSDNSGGPLCALWRPMCEFVSNTGSPPSIFLTINAGECQALQQPGSGWTYVPMSTTPPGDAPLSAFEVDPSTGSCATGTVPMHRFVNPGSTNGGLVNHRYVNDDSILAQMRVRPGWHEEGIAFCVESASLRPIDIAVQNLWDLRAPGPPDFLACNNGIGRYDWCMESANMTALSSVTPITASASDAYFAKTGARGDGYIEAVPGMGNDPGHSFAQTFYSSLTPGAGIFITSLDRTAGNVSSVATRNMIFDGDSLQHPFASIYDVDMDVQLYYRLFVRRVRAAGDGNAAYVQPLVTFVDASSGHRLVLSPGAIGTPPLSDFATRDAATGNTLVFIALGTSSVGRSTGLPALRTPAVFDSDNPWGWGGDFTYRINRTEFGRVIAMARAVDPALSTDPKSYAIETYGLKGEIVGTADIGYNVEHLELSLQRP